jgi:hypothetical protein
MNVGNFNYRFEGPFANLTFIEDYPGVYVVLGSHTQEEWDIIDVGEAEKVYSALEGHSRTSLWEEKNYEYLKYAVYYCEEEKRMAIEKQIREHFKPCCTPEIA